MHVMLIAPEGLPIPPRKGGSVQIYLSHLFSELANQRELQITLVSPGSENGVLEVSQSATHVTLKGPTDTYWRQVRRIIRSRNPDVIQIENRPAEVRSIMRLYPDKPVILNMHSLTFLGKRHLLPVHAHEVLERVHAVVCNSRDLMTTMRRRHGLPSSWRGHVIYPGVREEGTVLTQGREWNGSTFKVLFVGRVIQQKGVHVLIDAIRKMKTHSLSPVELTIVGRTPPWERQYRQRLKRMSRGVSVSFTGFVPPTALSSVYESHDVLVCPSQEHEAFGLVNLEAMTHGLPVVASKIGGIPEAVGSRGAILVVRYKNPSHFASALNSLTSHETYREYSQAAIQHARQFTWSKTATKFVSLYLSIR